MPYFERACWHTSLKVVEAAKKAVEAALVALPMVFECIAVPGYITSDPSTRDSRGFHEQGFYLL